jgi:hypothetical protein
MGGTLWCFMKLRVIFKELQGIVIRMDGKSLAQLIINSLGNIWLNYL